ncbi:NAD(P)H-dependent flavin oxidoreductase [Mesobacillus zeae]|uniref:Probable nitronate monooxygenase n=1 Tax=Mesobacillus zeae TaxID=1917180 RepID=A0A398BDJ2_9BACI|nr:nitronate monooxygenase [Mesobacillus zeae]RID88329.1 nitronate monooxygenase [Mesobacillus zeae]
MKKGHFLKQMGIDYPIIQAPMAGGVTTNELVAAVSNAGGLGMVGAGYLNPSQLSEQILSIREMTDKPFGVNLFVASTVHIDQKRINRSQKLLSPLAEQLGIENNSAPLPSQEEIDSTFRQHIDVLLKKGVRICSFTFGIPEAEVIQKLKTEGVFVIGTATTVEEASLNEKAGMDAVVLQGSEAGGHRGTFAAAPEKGQVGLMSLIPQAADKVGIPLIASGGIMDGRGLLAAKILGASAVQMGSAFLVCNESGAHTVHKDAILQACDDGTILTRSFSGKLARGINNVFIQSLKGYEEEFPEFPVQNTLTSKIRKTASLQQNPDYMSLWSGQSPLLARPLSASDLVLKVMEEAKIAERDWMK